MARKNHGRQALSHRDIARAADLSVETVTRLSFKKTWAGVRIDVAIAFARACGVNHLDLEAQRDYVRRRKMVHIQAGDENQKKFFSRLFALAQAA